MTSPAQIYDTIRPDRSAWRSVADGGDVDGKAGLTLHLTGAHLDALDQILARTRDRKIEEITRAEFSHPALDPFLADVAREIQTGKGVAIIEGCTPARHSDDDMARAFWGVGLHLGLALPQTAAGDRIDHIRDSGYNPTGRERPRTQYGNGELLLHTDNASGEILGLMTLQTAKSGGVSRVASSLAVHNEILSRRPDLMPALYNGYPYHRKGRQPLGEPDIAPFDTPVFCNIDGHVSCRYVRNFMMLTAKERGEPLPPALEEALDYFDAIKTRASFGVEFTLERGEMVFLSNLTCLHARTEFEDYPEAERRRHLLRLWLKALPQGRPFDPRMDMFYGSKIDHSAPALL